MAVEQQNWRFNISAEVVNGDQLLHIHPENFTNLLINYDYQNQILPTILAKVNLDKNFMDFIIKNSETLEVYLTIQKFTHAVDNTEDKSAAFDFIKGTYLVTIGSDINYNKELDYMDAVNTELPIEDKFRETYIGLISKESIDANKTIANEVVHTTLHQDLVLSYLLPNCHVLIEPFEHNEMHNNLVIPPLDTLASVIDYLNSIQVFYSTSYILFFDEPKVTYLISKSGKATLMKGEDHKTVFINMRSLKDSNNLTLGMNDNKEANAYEVDIPIVDSIYNIDKDLSKKIESIDAIINPSLEKSVVSGDTVKNLKNNIKSTMKNFLMTTLEQTLSSLNIGSKISDMMTIFTHASDAIQKVSMNLVSQVGESVNQFGSTVVQAVGSQIETIQGQVNKILQQLPANIMGNASKSIQKSLMDSRFMAADISRAAQKEIKSDFWKSLEETASGEYKKDFVNNNINAVTYVLMQEVTGATTNKINELSSNVTQTLADFQNKITSKMGEFSNFTAKNVEILQELQKWKKKVLSSMASSSTGSQSSGPGHIANSSSGQLLKQIVKQEQNLSTIIDVSDTYGGIAKQTSEKAEQINNSLKDISDQFTSFLGSFTKIDEQDVKSNFISNIPARIFGSQTLSIDQLIFQTTKTGCFGGGGETGMANTWGDMASGIGGVLNFSDLSNLESNLMKFDLSEIGSLGLSHFNFDLNLGNIGNKIGKIVGTKLMKVKNDNPNMLKNLKSEIELSKNQIIIHKFGLDPDVFTPNKEFIIKNYDGHEDKDGKFILTRKVLVFVREGEDFKCNSELFFNKVPDNAPSQQ